MKVPELIDEVHQRVPTGAPFGTRWKAESVVTGAQGAHRVAVAARIDGLGRRREQFWFDDVRVERSMLLRLTCPQSECPHVISVRQQWLTFLGRGTAPRVACVTGPQPLMQEVAVVVGTHHITARPARFPCFTRCPHDAHPPLTIEKTGFDLFEDGQCLGGGVVESGDVRQPRLPNVRAAEAYVLARHLEALAALGASRDAARPGPEG